MTSRAAMVLIVIGVATVAAAQPAQPSLFELVGRYGTQPNEVRALLAKGADPNQGSNHALASPLEAAIGQVGYHGTEGLPVVRVLIEAGADLNPRKIKSPLFAAMGRSDDLYQLLLSKGADPNLPDLSGQSPLQYVISAYKSHDKAVMLIAAGANVNAKDNDGYTVLISAARTELVRTVDLLIRKGANVNAKGRFEETALMAARSARMAAKLIEHGADVNARAGNGKSVLAHYPTGAIRELLLKHGAVE